MRETWEKQKSDFIELTEKSKIFKNQKILINVKSINFIDEERNGTTYINVGDNTHIFVEETDEIVKELIRL